MLRHLIPLVVAGSLACGCADFMRNPGQADQAQGEGGGAEGGAGGSAESAGSGSTSGGGAQAPRTRSASVMTWNLETFPLTDAAFERTVAIVEAERPDVLAIQEIADVGAFYALVDALPDYKGVINDDSGAYQRLAILYRHERVRLDAVETLFVDDWYAFPRPPLKAHVAIEDIDFTVVVVHLKAQIDQESQERRKAGCEALEEWARKQLSTGGDPDIVLLGDFNDEITDPAGANVYLPFLDRPDLYAFLTEPAAAAGDYTYLPFEKLIDHVLVTTNTFGEIGSGATEIMHLDASVPDYSAVSDHRPVRTWLAW